MAKFKPVEAAKAALAKTNPAPVEKPQEQADPLESDLKPGIDPSPAPEENWQADSASFLIRVDLPYTDKAAGIDIQRGHYLSNDPQIADHVDHLLAAGHGKRLE